MADPKEKKSGKGGMIMTMGALTLIAAACGGLFGKVLLKRAGPATAAAPAAVVEKSSSYAGDTDVRELSPIVTNLASASGKSIRLQVAIVYARKAVEAPQVLAAQIGDDLVAFLKTLTLPQLEGASGLQNLREDLNERASIRSQGKVREVIIETLVTE